MQDQPQTTTSYGMIAKTLHWAFVLIFAYGIAKQIGDISELQDRGLLNFEMVFATVFLALLALRYVYIRNSNTPSLPDTTPRWQQIAARVVHLGMYCGMGLIAITGLMIGALVYLGWQDGLVSEGLMAVHGFANELTIALIFIHIAAALYHRFKKDGVWSTMVPVWTKDDRA